jgi:hypothetical protein
MAKTATCAALFSALLSSSASAISLVNPGFETGNTSGWTSSGTTFAFLCASAAIGCAPSGGNYFGVLTNGFGSASLSQDLGSIDPGIYEFGAYVSFGTNSAAGNFAQGQISLTAQGAGQSATVGRDPNALNGQFNTQIDNFFFTDWFLLTGVFEYTGLSAVPFLININVQNFGTAGLQLLVDNAFVRPVPIPAALPLFATGVAALAYAGRRKRKAKATEAAA